METMFTAVLFVSATKSQQAKCPSRHERINEVRYVQKMECYSEIKKPTTQTDLKNTMLSEETQTKKVWFCLEEMLRTGKSIEPKVR